MEKLKSPEIAILLTQLFPLKKLYSKQQEIETIGIDKRNIDDANLFGIWEFSIEKNEHS